MRSSDDTISLMYRLPSLLMFLSSVAELVLRSLVFLLAGAPQGNIALDPSEYPEVRRGDTVETLHGVQIADPYRWLEDPDSPETVACAHPALQHL